MPSLSPIGSRLSTVDKKWQGECHRDGSRRRL